MSLASLTIDLTLGLSKFEADSGKAAQIITRDSERMSRAAKAVSDALTKQADQAGRTQAEYLALAAAQAGLGDTAQRLVTVIERTATISAQVGTAASAGFGTASAAVQSYAQKQRELQTELVSSILQVNAAYRAQREAIRSAQDSGSLTTDQLKFQLASLAARREEAITTLKAAADEQRATLATAEAEARAADQRGAAARKLIDQQNGLTATYRAQLQALRELRDAGSISPAQFRQAGAELVAKQPAVQLRTAQSEADASAAARAAQIEADAVEKRAVAFEKLRNIVAQSNFQALTKQAVEDAAAEEAAAASTAKRAAQFEDLRNKVARLNFQQQTEQIQAQTAAEQAAAIATAKRAEQFDNLRAKVAQLNYREQISQLKEQEAAEKSEADATAKRADQFQRLRDTVSKLNYQALIEEQHRLDAANRATIDSNNAFIAAIERQSASIGKSRTELLAEEAARRGVTAQVAPFIAKISEAEKNLNKFGTTSKVTQFQLQQLHYTVSDVIASLASGISPLTILAQQGGQVADAFGGGTGGIRNAFRAVLGLITPVRLAIGGLAAAAGVAALAFYEGSKQSKDFADSIVLSGNFAGQTEGQFNALAKRVAATGQVSISAAREYGQALVSTGQVGPQVFEKAAEAAARYGAATGKTAKDVATDFAGMSDDVKRWATDHNKQLNFLTASQLKQIETLQNQGNAVAAQGLVYDALNERLRTLDPNLGTIERGLRTVTNAWRGFWDNALDIGRAETVEDKLVKVNAQIAFLNQQQNGRPNLPAFSSAPQLREDDPAERARRAALQDKSVAERNGLLREQGTKYAKAQADASNALITKEAEAAQASVDGWLKRGKAAGEYQKEVDKQQANFKKLALAGTPLSDAQQKAVLDKVKKDFTDTGAVGEADQQRKALLDQDIKFIQERLAREKEALQFGQTQLNAQYSAGLLSLQEYYEQRRTNIAEGVQKELNELTDEQARLEVELDRGAFKDPHERIQLQTQLNESVAKSAQLQVKAARDVVLANYEEQASLKALGEQVNQYRASLFQAEGNDFAAAQLRQQEQLVRAKDLARRSGGAISDDDLSRLVVAIQRGDEFAEVQRKIAIATTDAARAEDAYLLRISRGGANQIDQDTAIYQIRATSLVQLGELTEKARALAEASTDPKLKQAAADLELAYAKAADTVDPALNRIREGADELAGSFRNVFDTIFDGSATGADALKALRTAVVGTLTKTFISDPLQAALKSGLQGLVTGPNSIGSFLRFGTPSAVNAREGEGINVAGAGYSPARDSQDASVAFDALQSSVGGIVTAQVTQTTAAQSASSALVQLTAAAQSAAQSLVQVAATSGGGGGFGNFIAGYGTSGYSGTTAGIDYSGISFPLADGANRIPRDGFKATLHKDEAVVPAKYNPAAGGYGARASGPDELHIHSPKVPLRVTDSQTTTQSDGRKIKRVVVDTITEEVYSGGRGAQAIQGKYGVQRQNPRRA